ncbi:hypothetical protein DMC30DRAFT_353784 [Rhodotorula diobovata]|uniref:Uncharacterized protein n=1 Tax=Rhodotorula diobovata TaxID=5288 RepID=A0A5C5FRQ0_9BASI|nr:hypothetical protein DMC30DRAFT_353784 [Rhodotorula diobovata]
MSGFRLPFSTSTSPAPPPDLSHDPLTTLPPRRFSRPESTLLTPSPTGSPPAEDWASRHSFAELLSRDTHGSALVRDASLYGEGLVPNGEAGAAEGRGHVEGMLALPGADFGVVGPDARLCLQELQRLRTSLALKRRRHTGYVAGAMSLVVLGVTLWYLVEACWALGKSGGKGKGALRWVEVAVWLAVLSLWPAVLLFLRSRRPSLLSMVGLASAAVTAFLHLAIAFANLILSFVWKEELSNRCAWGIDVAWTSRDKGEYCADKGWKAWSLAAAVRLLVTVAFLSVWLVFLRRYHRALLVPSIVSPSQLPSAELRALLERHRADIVPLSSPLPTLVDPSASPPHADDLPHAPDRATAFYASVSDGAWSYDAAHARWGSSGTRASERAEPGAGGAGGAAQWLGAKLWGGFGWLLGHGHDYGSLFSGLRRPASFASSLSPSSKRLSAGSSAPLLDPDQSLPASERPLPSPPNDTRRPSRDLPAPPLPPKDADGPSAAAPPSSTGSSGSTRGAIVYVRMSDGRLVRRLSTIASESDETRRSRSEATSLNSFAGGGSGGSGGAAGSGRSGSTLSGSGEGSFATALEDAHGEGRHAYDGFEGEVLLDGGEEPGRM